MGLLFGKEPAAGAVPVARCTRKDPAVANRPSDLTEREKHDAKERSNPRAVVLHEAVRQEGSDELNRSVRALFWSGLAAGLSMGFSMIGEGLLQAHLPDAQWRVLVTSFGYSFGFLIVILGRQQLFTENTLTVVLPLLHRCNLATFRLVLRLWAIVFASNILGTLALALVLAHTEMLGTAAHEAFAEIGIEAQSHDPWTTFLRAVLAGWLIALLVWMTPSVGHARILVIVAMTYLIALGQLAHVIAGSVEVAYVAATGEIGWGQYVAGFLLPTLAGNMAGGVGLTALVNHAQVHGDV
jgi:formate-nitrite transporter family protein